MSRLTIAAAASALWLAASPAAAEPFRNFVDMCLNTNADRQAAVSRAKGIGWHPMAADALGLGEDLEEATLHVSADPALMTAKGPPADLEMLVTGFGGGQMDFGVEGTRMEACVVGAVGRDPAELEAQLEERLGMPPAELDGQRLWMFTRAGAGFRSEAAFLEQGDEEALRTIAERKLYMAIVIPEGDVVVIMLATFRPDP